MQQSTKWNVGCVQCVYLLKNEPSETRFDVLAERDLWQFILAIDIFNSIK